MSTIKLCDFTALFGIFFCDQRYQDLMRFGFILMSLTCLRSEHHAASVDGYGCTDGNLSHSVKVYFPCFHLYYIPPDLLKGGPPAILVLVCNVFIKDIFVYNFCLGFYILCEVIIFHFPSVSVQM